MKKSSLVILPAFLLFAACTDKEPLFTVHSGPELGITFRNDITVNDTFNVLNFEYIYNGSGVGIGDFNRDGLLDVFLGGNQVSSRLYLNEGGLHFRDVTANAGVSTDRWVTGVAVADVNQDGWPDIYLAVAGITDPEHMRNLLFINKGATNGVPVFEESAHAYGIDDAGYSTMGAFFDYDLDGDPDLYVLTNALEKQNRNNLDPRQMDGKAKSNDRLYRNNGNGTFTDVSLAAGIVIEGYGLGVNISDINQDGWPDVYTSDDFLSNDLLWINQGDGTFRNMAGSYLKHQTYNGMGVDVADFNNDELPDIMVVDMLPPGHKRQKMMTAGHNIDHFYMSLALGYEPEYMRNTLQLNRGEMSNGGLLFSEIAFMSGVAKTDWSWAPLIADYDNDGWKDIFIANGYRKDVTDLDFIFYDAANASPFGTPEAKRERYAKKIGDLADVKLPNFMYHNNGSLEFQDVTTAWGFSIPTFSNGAAYADFDNDGDLDLITNNIDQEVILYENKTSDQNEKQHYIDFYCDDNGVYNQKIWMFSQGKPQYQEYTPFRGFESTVSPVVHFGVGNIRRVDSVRIEWPNRAVLRLTNVRVDTVIHFAMIQAHQSAGHPVKLNSFFAANKSLAYRHTETSPSDIKVIRTLIHELSCSGPHIATVDLNNDQLTDLFISGEKGQCSRLLIQQLNGTFQQRRITSDSTGEDGGVLFFDADGDGDMDLYVSGSCPSILSKAHEHELYLNDGTGHFTLSIDALPHITTSSACVVSADYDGDGDLDLFVGGNINEGNYPLPARSYILRNDGGKFKDVTRELNPSLERPGIVSAAVWVDINNDNRPDLIMDGEWMPVRAFLNEGKTFSEATEQMGLGHTDGWWTSIAAADLNGDGYLDIVAGNTGRNSYYQPTEQEPIEIVAKDFDGNGSIDPLITYYNPVEQDRFLIHNRLVLIDQIPGIKKRFENFKEYARTPFSKVFSDVELDGAYKAQAFTLHSQILINHEGKHFERKDLPDEAQFSVINGIFITDLNGDGLPDLVAVGNDYNQETLFGNYDASTGIILLGDGRFNWTSVEPSESNLIVDKGARCIQLIKTSAGQGFLIGNNNDSIQFFLFNKNVGWPGLRGGL